MSDPPRRFVDSELLLRRPGCREKGGRFFFVRCVGGFRVSERGFSRGGAAGSGVCGLTVLHCAAKLVRQDSGATGRLRSVLYPSAEASLRIAPCRDGGCGRPGVGVRRCAVESERPIEGERVVAGIRGGALNPFGCGGIFRPRFFAKDEFVRRPILFFDLFS